MKRPHKGKRRSKSLEDTALNVEDAASVNHPSVRPTHNEITECGSETRKAVTRHLHELLNSLWAASLQIELACTKESCPEEFRDTLEQLRSSILEAMESVARTSTLIDSLQAGILADAPARDCDPS